MAVDVSTETVIARPLEVVASYAGDPTHAPEWYANIRSVEWRTPPPIAIGSQIDFVAQFLGRRLAYTYEIVELSPGQRLVMRTRAGTVPDGDDVRVGARRGVVHPDDTSQPRRTVRLLASRRAVHGWCGPTGEPQGPGAAQAPARGRLTDDLVT